MGRHNSNPASQDPFYQAPPHLEKYSPGTVLRIRTAPSEYFDPIPNCSVAYHIVHRTTDNRYRASWAVTTLLLPESYSQSAAPSPLLSYQIPYNSPALDASPSFDHSTLITPGNPVSVALGRGWLVVVPDFEGPTGSYGSGVQSGHATIDSIRAALSLSRTRQGHVHHNQHADGSPPKLRTINRYAMWGYSGGSVATEFAAELSVQYAPELDFAGAVLGGVVPNITGVLDRVNGSPYVGNVFAFLVGSLNQHPEAYNFLVDSLKPEGPYNRTTFLAVKGMRIVEAFAFYAGQNVFDYFVQGRNIVNVSLLKKVWDSKSSMGYHGVPQMPMFVYQAVSDSFTPISNTDALVERFCRASATIRYERNTVGGHFAEITNGMPRALAWLATVLEGPGEGDPLRGCDVRTVAVNITDISDGF